MNLLFLKGAEEAVVFKKKSNPNVKPGSLVKAAWLTKETKELIAQVGGRVMITVQVRVSMKVSVRVRLKG